MRVWGCFGGGATSASWKEEWDEEKRACRRAKFLFLISPLERFQVLSDRNKNDRKLREEIFGADSKILSWKKGKKAATNPANPANDSCQICKYFFDVKYGIGESLYSYRRFRRLPLTALPL